MEVQVLARLSDQSCWIEFCALGSSEIGSTCPEPTSVESMTESASFRTVFFSSIERGLSGTAVFSRSLIVLSGAKSKTRREEVRYLV
jgi:hypothetical protein